MIFSGVSMLQTWRTYDWTSKHLLPRIVDWDNMFILICCIVNFQKEAQMYRIISQYSKYFSVNSLNYPIKITDIQIYKSLDYQNLFWLKKQFSSIRILSVIWISFSGTDKICLFITVKLYEGQNFVPCIRSGNKRGTKSWKIDTILYYSFAFNVLIINVI